jgi:hypothetical protein
MITGIAWYRADQWEQLRALSADKDKLHDTYEEWLAEATAKVRDLARLGVATQPVHVDVNELALWCKQQGCPLDGAARARFVTDKLQKGKG